MKIICLLIFFPIILSAQDRQMLTEDFFINSILENTANYFQNKEQKSIIPFRLNLHKKDTIKWDKASLNKWQIILHKDS
jgi:hypothetical protein